MLKLPWMCYWVLHSLIRGVTVVPFLYTPKAALFIIYNKYSVEWFCTKLHFCALMASREFCLLTWRIFFAGRVLSGQVEVDCFQYFGEFIRRQLGLAFFHVLIETALEHGRLANATLSRLDRDTFGQCTARRARGVPPGASHNFSRLPASTRIHIGPMKVARSVRLLLVECCAPLLLADRALFGVKIEAEGAHVGAAAIALLLLGLVPDELFIGPG